MLNAAAHVVTGTPKFDCGLGQILLNDLHWLDVLFFKLAVTVHRCLNGRAPPYLSDYGVAVASADTRRHLLSTNLVTGSTLTAVGPFQLPAAQSGTLSQILSGTRPSMETVSGVCSKHICSLDTSAFSALEVPDNNCAL